MNKPIRCTTHFHACDCREYEFEQLREENNKLQKKLDDKRVYIKQLKDNNLSLVELIEPMSRKLNEKDAEIEALIKKFKNEEDCWLISMESRDEKITDLQKENQEMREALVKTIKNLSSVLHFLHSTGWQHYDVEKPEFQCHYLLSETIFTLHNINLSETPNSSKEGVNCSHCSGNHLNFDCPTMANE